MHMDRDHDASLKSWLIEALSAFCPVNIARVMSAWIDAEPARIEVETQETRQRRQPSD
jgi:hypothetical protein